MYLSTSSFQNKVHLLWVLANVWVSADTSATKLVLAVSSKDRSQTHICYSPINTILDTGNKKVYDYTCNRCLTNVDGMNIKSLHTQLINYNCVREP